MATAPFTNYLFFFEQQPVIFVIQNANRPVVQIFNENWIHIHLSLVTHYIQLNAELYDTDYTVIFIYT